MDPKSGFCHQIRTYSSLRPPAPLPPVDHPLSVSQFCHPSPTAGDTTFVVNATTGDTLSFSQFFSQVRSLAYSLQQRYSLLCQNDVAFILSPPSIRVPVVYFALLSLGIVVSPANPLSSNSEIAHQIQLSKPVVAFATSETSHKIPSLKYGTILLDSPEFISFLTQPNINDDAVKTVKVNQSDTAAILYSSGTTGRVKGVMLTHRNLIAKMAVTRFFNTDQGGSNDDPPRSVTFFTVPFFHVFGFFMLLAAALSASSVVMLERFDFEQMLRAVEKYKITSMPVSPPLVLAFVKSELTKKYDLSSLQGLGCGGAPLAEDIAQRFNQKFPNVLMVQGYGLTETVGGATNFTGSEEAGRYGSVGRFVSNMEAKIVDPQTSEPLTPGQRGELWLRGPIVMKGYVGDEKATAETLDTQGWLKTGDICYFDSQGFLYIVDRLKELIKYKAYQVPPAELEHLLVSHPEIADAAVIPYPDEEAGQIPMAYVVRITGSSITEAQVMDFIAEQVAPYKKIRRVAFINSIPRSPPGKILRKELGYGLTETVGGATNFTGSKEAGRYGSVGRLVSNMEAKIVDPQTGEPLPPGQRGELWLRGPIVMKGYVGDEKATAETLDTEGWLKTGDICYFDSQGFLYIVDRLKELIKYKAYQVPPAELEHLLVSHPEIADAAVIPYAFFFFFLILGL